MTRRTLEAKTQATMVLDGLKGKPVTAIGPNDNLSQAPSDLWLANTHQTFEVAQQTKQEAQLRHENARLRQLIVQAVMSSLEVLVAEERRLTKRMFSIKEPRGALLEPRPAIGPLSAWVLLSALDDTRRFGDQQAVAHDGALIPTIHQSGAIRQLGPINRKRWGEVRRLWWPCAHMVVQKHSHRAKPFHQCDARIA